HTQPAARSFHLVLHHRPARRRRRPDRCHGEALRPLLPRLTMRIGPYELSSNLFLSPLAGYTNLPFRLVVREIGGLDWTTTDLVNARSLLEKNPRGLQMIRT